MLTVSPSWVSLIPYIQKNLTSSLLEYFFFSLRFFPLKFHFAKSISPYLKMTPELLPQKSNLFTYFTFSLAFKWA